MRPYLLVLSLLLPPNLIFSESLGGLESLQKQSADAIKNARSASEDPMALDFLAGKINQNVWKFDYPNFSLCPQDTEKCERGEESNLPGSCVCTFDSSSKRWVIAPRPQLFIKPSQLLTNNSSSLVPIKEYRKRKQNNASPSCDQAINPIFLPPSLNSLGQLYCENDPEATVKMLKDKSEVGSLEDRGGFLDCDQVPGTHPGGAELTCECINAQGETFTKNGNNGTVSCQTFCSGDQWPGGTGGCRIAFQQSHHQSNAQLGNQTKNIQVGYLSIPAPIPYPTHPQDPRKDFFEDPAVKIPRLFSKKITDSSGNEVEIPILAPKRVQILGFINHPTEPFKLKAIQVQAGGTRAEINISDKEPPTPLLCEVTSDSNGSCSSIFPGKKCFNEGTDIGFSLIQTSGIAVSGEFNEQPLETSEIFPQIMESPKSHFIKKTFVRAPSKEHAGLFLTNSRYESSDPVNNEPTSNYKQGLLQVRGRLVGPSSITQTECVAEVAVRFYDPPPPKCISFEVPDRAEPEEEVQVRVLAKNEITSAELINHTQNQRFSLSFAPTPGATVTGEANRIIRKSDVDAQSEELDVLLKGPGSPNGVLCGKKTLHFKRPDPPVCAEFSANPQILRNLTETALTIKVRNRVQSATVKGSNGVELPVVLGNTLDEEGNRVFTRSFSKPDNQIESVVATLTSRWHPGLVVSCPAIDLNCERVAGPECNLRVNPEKAKDQEMVQLELTCPPSAQIASASIQGQNVNLVNGKASVSYQKSGTSEETVGATVDFAGTCVEPAYLSATVLGEPPCRFANPNHIETLEIPVWKWNTLYNVFEAQRGIKLVSREGVTKDRRYTIRAVGTTTQTSWNNVGVTVTRAPGVEFTATRTASLPGTGKVYEHQDVECLCGQMIINDNTANARCVAGAPKLSMAITDPEDPRMDPTDELYAPQSPNQEDLFFDDAQALVNIEPANRCMRKSRNRMDFVDADANEVKFSRNYKAEVNFKYEVQRVYEQIDKVANQKLVLKYPVANNLNFSDAGGATPEIRTLRFTGEPRCKEECEDMDFSDPRSFINGKLCLTKAVQGMTRRRFVGGRWREYFDSDAVCEKETLTGLKTHWNSDDPVTSARLCTNRSCRREYTMAVPGHFRTKVTRQLDGKTIDVDKICGHDRDGNKKAGTYACILETTRVPDSTFTSGANTTWVDRSNSFLWVEVGPLEDKNCKVTRIDTAASVVRNTITWRSGGCFTADTPITMANGKEKRVSDIRIGDHVFNPHYRTGIRVKKVVKGPEPKPLFEVALNGKKIKVTEDHPFFTERGWVQTLALKKGDKLFGEGKGKVVESIRKLPYKKPVDVWNFELDTDDPLAHIVMANGVPTGDLVTQLELKKPARKLP